MIVYRRGSLTIDNFTPRPDKDLTGGPGQKPGLSAFRKISLGPRQKAQGIDVNLLVAPLAAIPDDPQQGGEPGHVAIVPVDASGEVDYQRLREWANTRGGDVPHPFTQLVLNAVVEVDIRYDQGAEVGDAE